MSQVFLSRRVGIFREKLCIGKTFKKEYNKCANQDVTLHIRATMGRDLAEISWETEVWVSEAPTHIIHFNGKDF